MSTKGEQTTSEPRDCEVGGVMPDGPAMRSVAIMSSGLSLSGAPLASSKGASLPSLPVKMGIKKPSLGIARPEKLSTHRTSFVKNEWSGSALSTPWDVKGADLEMVPWEFPLERTHREIKADAGVVAQRISDALATMSVETEYCSQKAKAKCQTLDRVNFRIRLFAGGEYGQPVVVEIQRRSGSASSFMNTCRALLDAAEGKGTGAPKVPRGPPKCVGLDAMKCLANAKVEHNSDEIIQCALDMLKSDNAATIVLGLENLCCMTDSLKTTPSVARECAKQVLLCDDHEDVREDLRLFMERDKFMREFEHSDYRVNQVDTLRTLALNVMENSLCLCSVDQSLTPVMTKQSWFCTSLVPTLLEEVKRAEWNANDACHAASCLCSLLDSSVDLRTKLVEHGDDSLIEEALAIGKASHALLATETERCLSIIRG